MAPFLMLPGRLCRRVIRWCRWWVKARLCVCVCVHEGGVNSSLNPPVPEAHMDGHNQHGCLSKEKNPKMRITEDLQRI